MSVSVSMATRKQRAGNGTLILSIRVHTVVCLVPFCVQGLILAVPSGKEVKVSC